MKMQSQLKISSLIWASKPPLLDWPAKVIAPPEDVEHRENHYYVFFYGTHIRDWVKKKNCCPYGDYYAKKFHRGSQSKTYTKGIKEISRVYHKEIQQNSPTYKSIIDSEEEQLMHISANITSAKKVPKKKKKNVEKGTKSSSVSSSSSHIGCVHSAKSTQYDQLLFPKFLLPPTSTSPKKDEQKKGNDYAEEETKSPPVSSSSSCIVSVNVHEYRKVTPYDVAVELYRCDEIRKSTAD